MCMHVYVFSNNVHLSLSLSSHLNKLISTLCQEAASEFSKALETEMTPQLQKRCVCVCMHVCVCVCVCVYSL